VSPAVNAALHYAVLIAFCAGGLWSIWTLDPQLSNRIRRHLRVTYRRALLRRNRRALRRQVFGWATPRDWAELNRRAN
jgi:hypothetical protein